MKRKIIVTTGSRADYGILRQIIKEILASKKLDLYLIVTGMHLSKKHGYTINEIKNDGFKIHISFKMLPQTDSTYAMANALGKGIISFTKIFKKIKPDINVIFGDRDEMLASALAAYHLNIPSAHIHGGDKTQGGIDEYNRHAITKISNIHFAATKKSKDRILLMGENPKYVFLTGSPSIDEVFANKITNKIELQKKYDVNLDGNEILLLYHSVTTQSEQSGKEILNILRVMIRMNRPIIAIAPNSDAGSKMIFKYLETFAKKYNFIQVYPSVPRSDFLGLLKYCGVLVGNSSSGMIEASCFDIPVVNIGMRQKDREKGNNVVDVMDTSTTSIHKAMMSAFRMKKQKIKKNRIYGDGTASKKIVKHLERITLDKKLIQKQICY